MIGHRGRLRKLYVKRNTLISQNIFLKKTVYIIGGMWMSESKAQPSGGLIKLVSEHRQKVAALLQELGLEEEFFAVIVNGRKASLNEEIEKGAKIIVLPKIKGG